MEKVGAIVLAAGGSRRFGSPKQLARIDGRSLVARAADAAIGAGCRPTVVVLGAHAEAIAPELEGAAVEVCVCPDWTEGMGSSIRRGLARLLEIAPGSRAAMIVLADQPHVTDRLLRSLAERFEKGPEPAAACRFAGVLGPPAIFGSRLFARLQALEGDEGARSLLRSGEWPVAELEFPDGARDVDEPRDL